MERRIPIRRTVCGDVYSGSLAMVRAEAADRNPPFHRGLTGLRCDSIGCVSALYGRCGGVFREAFVAEPMERRIPNRRTVCGYVHEQWSERRRRIGIRLSIGVLTGLRGDSIGCVSALCGRCGGVFREAFVAEAYGEADSDPPHCLRGWCLFAVVSCPPVASRLGVNARGSPPDYLLCGGGGSESAFP